MKETEGREGERGRERERFSAVARHRERKRRCKHVSVLRVSVEREIVVLPPERGTKVVKYLILIVKSTLIVFLF